MELAISNVIKLVIGILVVVVVIIGVSIFFGAKVISFFKNLFSEEVAELILGVLFP